MPAGDAISLVFSVFLDVLDRDAVSPVNRVLLNSLISAYQIQGEILSGTSQAGRQCGPWREGRWETWLAAPPDLDQLSPGPAPPCLPILFRNVRRGEAGGLTLTYLFLQLFVRVFI